MSKVFCQQCDGTGIVVKVEAAPIKGSKLRSSVHTCEMRYFCDACDGRGTVEGAAASAASPEPAPITFGGHQLDAPGFTAEQFERAICRALVDRLEIREVNGRHIVSHPGLTSGYHVTRHSCTCKAGAVGTPCKHRAALIFHLDVREPAVRRQWQALDRKAAA